MSGGTTQTQTNSISPWMEEAAKSQLGKATALTDINQNPYKQYEGQRIAEFNPMQQQYFQGVQNLQGSGAIGQGIGAAGEATQRALGTSYNPYATGQFGAQAGQYMDPYMQNVVDIQQREAQRQADIAGTQRGAQAVKAGAFGGSRQAIENAEAARNLATQKGDIQARGLQDAYTRGQQQFNTEQQLREQSRQYGAGLGMQGLQTALSGASQLGGLGSTQFGQQKDVLGLQSVAGAQQQAQEQAKLSQGYEDFLAKEKYPYQQLEFMSNIMRGTPYGTTTSMYSPGPSTASTLLGAGTSLAGAYMMGGGKFFKSGGLADAYAAGGSVDSPDNVQSIADNLSDAQLQQAAAMAQARGDKEQADIIQQEMASRAALRSGASALPEEQGIGQLPAGNMTYANGGIIAFADGGDVERYQFGGTIYDPVTGVPISAENASGNDLTMLESLGIFNPANRRALERAEKAAAQRQSAMPYNKATMPAAGYTRTDPRAAAATTFADSIKAVETAPKVDAAPRAPGAAAPGIAPRATDDTAASGIEALQQKYFGPLDQQIGALRNQRVEMAAGIQDLANSELAATKKAIEERGDPYKARDERLTKREKDLEGMDTKYAGLALLQAGAAMMSTPGGLGMAIGKGVQVGSDRYLSGIEKINAAKEKFAEARDRMEDLRISRDDMNAKEIRQAERGVREARMKGQELFYNGAVNDLNMSQKNISAVFGAAANALNTDKEIASRERVSKAQIAAANRTPGEIQMIERVMKEKNIPFTEALSYISGAKREGITEEKLRGEWLDSAKRMQIAQDYPNVKTFEDYKTVMGVGGGGGGFKLVGVRQSP